MVKIDRIENELTKEAQEILAQEKRKSNGTYNKKEVVTALRSVFHGKCYICESNKLKAIQIEHIKPYKGDKDLKFDWYNLLLACGHCNNIKGTKYDDILDCTKEEVDKLISFRIHDSFLHNIEVEIQPVIEEKKVLNTVELLKSIYSGETLQKKIEADEIKQEIVGEMYTLICSIQGLKKAIEIQNEEDIQDQLILIKMLLKSASPFAAFKRWFIKDNRDSLPDILLSWLTSLKCQ